MNITLIIWLYACLLINQVEGVASDQEGLIAEYLETQKYIQEQKEKLKNIDMQKNNIKSQKNAIINRIKLLKKDAPSTQLIDQLEKLIQSHESDEKIQELMLVYGTFIPFAGLEEKILNMLIDFGRFKMVELFLDQVSYSIDAISRVLLHTINLVFRKNRTNIDIIALLLRKGANPNFVDTLGNTPLKNAISTGTRNESESTQIIALLIEHGADAYRKSGPDNSNAIDHAKNITKYRDIMKGMVKNLKLITSLKLQKHIQGLQYLNQSLTSLAFRREA